jgi:SAM-dependent methyltransferase
MCTAVLPKIYLDMRYGGRYCFDIPDLNKGVQHGLVYSNLTALKYVFRNVEIFPADVLVDVGCGQGRVLNYWLGLGIKNKLIGIEFDRKTAGSAAKAYRKRKNVQIICGDAAEVAAECNGSLFYLFNPLLPDGMCRFERRLRGKPVRILYYYPRYISPFENENWQIARFDQGEADFPLAVIVSASASK